MRPLRSQPPWNWSTRKFSWYVLLGVSGSLAADEVWNFTPWEAIPVTAAIYVAAAGAVSAGARFLRGRGKGRAG